MQCESEPGSASHRPEKTCEYVMFFFFFWQRFLNIKMYFCIFNGISFFFITWTENHWLVIFVYLRAAGWTGTVKGFGLVAHCAMVCVRGESHIPAAASVHFMNHFPFVESFLIKTFLTNLIKYYLRSPEYGRIKYYFHPSSFSRSIYVEYCCLYSVY